MPKISEYPAATTPLTGDETLIGNQEGVTKRIAVSDVKEAVFADTDLALIYQTAKL